MQAVEAQIRAYVAKHYTVLPPRIHPQHRFQQDLGLSEWEFLEVLVHIEHRFGVNLPDEMLHEWLTVSQLSKLVYQHAKK